MKLYRFQIILFVTFLFVSGLVPVSIVSDVSDNMGTDALTSGSINGIDYSYGQRTFETSGNITTTVNGSVMESFSQRMQGTTTLPLITSIQPVDFYFHLYWEDRYQLRNDTYEQRMNNATYYQDVISYITETVPLKFDSDPTIGESLMNIEFIENLTLHKSAILSQNTGEFVGQYPLNVSYIAFNDKTDSDDTYRRTVKVVPEVIVVDVQTETHEVNYERNITAFSIMNYYNRYSMAYNVSASAYQVNITDGENFGLHVSMFDKVEAEYLEYALSYIGYYFSTVDVTELRFTNGTEVSTKGYSYPFSLMPVSATASGTIIQAGYRQVSTKLLSTYQGVVAGFISRADNSTQNQADLAAQLSVWGVSTSTTLAAYSDGNDNGRLDLSLENSELSIQSPDKVEAIGLAEAYETNVTNAYYSSHLYNNSYNAWGLGISHSETNVNRTDFQFNTATYSFGNVDATPTNTFNFETPVENSDGTVEFDFGMTYSNFPVTWINTTDGTTAVDNENIAYKYHVLVDPATGRAQINTTWEYGGIVDPGLKNKAADLSLALFVKSEFFGLSARYTATPSNETLNASRTKTFTRIGVQIGGDQPATEIGVDGPKQYYLVNGVNTTANFDALRLVTVKGSFSGERSSPFSSESENTAGSATKGSLVETLDVNFVYTADLVVISYPTWNGEDIVHDPEYGVNYRTNEQDDDSDPTDDSSDDPTDDSSSNTTDTGSTVPTSDGGGETDIGGLYSLGIFSLIIPIITIVIIRRKS